MAARASCPISLPAARGAGARAVWARRARVRRALAAGAPHAPPPARVHMRVRRCRGRVCAEGGAAARTVEVQRGEGRVGLERGGQLLGPLVADAIDCGTRGGRTRGVGAASARAACARGWRAARPPRLHACMRVRRCRGRCVRRPAPRHAPLRYSVVRVELALSAAASSLAPSAPMPLAAARGAGARAVWARRARVRRALGAGAPHAPPPARVHMRVRRCRGRCVRRAAPRHAPLRYSSVQP